MTKKKQFRTFEEARKFVRDRGLKSWVEWREWAKSGEKPADIPINPHVTYKDRGWLDFGDWLGTGSVLKGQFRQFEKAREFARGLRLRTKREWRDWAKSGEKPADIPASPGVVYKDHGWAGWGDWLGTGVVAAKKRQFRPFEEAREFARGLGLKGEPEWRVWSKSDAKPADIPSTPSAIYKDQGWTNWGDFLGTGNTRHEVHQYRPFKAAREFARGLRLRTYREWREWAKSGEKPADIPANPHSVYKNHGWAGAGDWLGGGNIGNPKIPFLPFEEAREFARGLGLKGIAEWQAWAKSGARPADIRTNPNRVYKDRGWAGWGDFLGTGNKSPYDHQYRLFEEAREFVRGLGLGSQTEWRAWAKTSARPSDIPSNPHVAYEGEFRGWADFLGYAPARWRRAPLLALLEDLRPRLPHLSDRELYAILAQGGALGALSVRIGGKRKPLALIQAIKSDPGEVEAAVAAGPDETPDEKTEGTAADDVITGDVDDTIDAIDSGDVSVVMDGDDDLPTLITPGGLRVADELEDVLGGLDHETADYLIRNRVAALWDAYTKGHKDAISAALEGDGGVYFDLIRERFTSERDAVEALEIPDGWAFRVNSSGTLPPNAMQRRAAYEVMTKRRVGNWSGAGAGKTNSAALASRVIGATNTLIVAANATVEGWRDAILNAFPDSVVHTTPTMPVPGRFNYTILNYEKFQQANRAVLVHRLVELGYDFVVLDEIQLAKQRNADKSYRRASLEGLIAALSENNSELCVLGMSATPVINNLYEGRKLLEVVMGRSFADLEERATVPNALALHRALMLHGFRYKPEYAVEFGEPEIVEADGQDLLDDLLASRGVLATEQVVLPSKLTAVRDHIRRGTLIYTHYVDGMVYPIRSFIESVGLSVGVFTGADKTGLDDFKSKKVDVLIGSQPVSTGVDGIQTVCDRIVVMSAPWTGSEYEQLLGRVRRQGSAYSRVTLVWPQVVLEHEGERWSWDERRRRVIEYKRTLSDCAVDGTIPETLSISPTALLKRSREALEDWIERVNKDGLTVGERALLKVPLPPAIAAKVQIKHGDFSTINNRWGVSKSDTTHARLLSDPSEWHLYHTLYREARASWEETPADHVATHLKDRPDLKVGDFGCGECLLRDALPDHEVVGLDHVAIDGFVIACDMAHTPLEDGSLGAAVFSLSLMGKNWPEYLREAHRTLQPYGLLLVAEPAKRWGGGEAAQLEAAIEGAGFSCVASYQRGDFRYVAATRVSG